MTTVQEDYVREHLDDGVQCPACGQFAKRYRRKVNVGMVRSLAAMYRAGGTDWVHLPTQVGARSREEGKLAYWGLVEEQRIARPDGGRAGYWRLTERGVAYLHGSRAIPKYALIYNGVCEGFDGPMVTIRDVARGRFNLADLMAGR